jgi:hypothetical protein
VKQTDVTVAVLWSPTIDLYRYLTFQKLSNLLFMTTYVVFKNRLNPSPHVFRTHNSTSTSFVTYLNTAAPSVRSQGQTDFVYFDLSNAFK